MFHITAFYLMSETVTQDETGQNKKTPVKSGLLIGKLRSVYQNEFYQAEQAGLRPQGVVEMSSFDYKGEPLIEIDSKPYTIYRTYLKGTDRIELYFGERVGNG